MGNAPPAARSSAPTQPLREAREVVGEAADGLGRCGPQPAAAFGRFTGQDVIVAGTGLVHSSCCGDHDPPLAPAPVEPDRMQIYRHFERQALAGVGRFKRSEREAARQRASAWTDAEAGRLWNEQIAGHQEAQRHLDYL